MIVFKRGCFLVLFLLVTASLLFAQAQREIRVGTMSWVAQEAFYRPDMSYPIGYSGSLIDNEMMFLYDISVGIEKEWDDSGNPRNVQVAEVGYYYYDPENVIVPVSDAFKRVWKSSPPNRIIDGKDWTDSFYATDKVDSNIPSDVLIYTHCTSLTGIDIERWAYGYANADHDDYIIMEYLFTNTTSGTLQGVWFGIRTELNTTSYYPGDLWCNYYGATYADYAASDVSADSMRMYYMWDADELTASPNYDDKGNPDPVWGHMTEPQFMGHAVLHADKSPTDETDDPALPKKAGWSSREQSGDLNNVGHEGVYKLLSEIWDPALPNLYTVGGGWFRLPPPGFDFNGTDPVIEQEKTGLLSFGPYEMGPGEDVRIVLAFCGGMISNRLAIDAGRAYDSGYEGAYARIPMPYAVPGICEKGKLLTKDQKNQIIDSSRDILFSVASRAINNYKSSYGSGPLDIPMPPASPSIELTSMPGKIHLKWGDESASSTSDVAGYRIYRNYWRSPEITVPTDTTHILIADLSADKREYEDTDVIRGQQYWYYIAAYNSAGLESSRFLNRTSGQDEAVSPTKSPEPKWQNTAMVVPNPYHARAVRKYSGRRLLFVNLPAYCNIHVYTMTGDKVQTLRHKSGTGEEEWEEQLTFSNQRITSGIYFFVVEELDGPNGSDTGKITKGKFIVVN